MNVLNIATLDIPVAMLRMVEQMFSHFSRSNILVYFSHFFLYLPSSFNNPCHFPWIMFRQLVGLWAQGSQRCSWDSWIFIIVHHHILGSYEKLADIDIDPFGDHNKTDAHPNETGGVMGRGSTWEPE